MVVVVVMRQDLPDIVLDTEKVESGQSTPYGGRSGGGRVSAGGSGLGRVNLTWNKNAPPGSTTPASGSGKGGGSRVSPATNGPRFAPGQRNPMEIDIDALEDKPWRKPGADPTDYFNYGFTEESWRAYCSKQVQMRMEMSMQGKIRVWEGQHKNATERQTDALPPELLALAASSGPPPVVMPHTEPSRPPSGLWRDRAAGLRGRDDDAPRSSADHPESGSGTSIPSQAGDSIHLPPPSSSGEAIPTTTIPDQGAHFHHHLICCGLVLSPASVTYA